MITGILGQVAVKWCIDKPVVEERIVCINCTERIDASEVRAVYLKVKVVPSCRRCNPHYMTQFPGEMCKDCHIIKNGHVVLTPLQSYFNNKEAK